MARGERVVLHDDRKPVCSGPAPTADRRTQSAGCSRGNGGATDACSASIPAGVRLCHCTAAARDGRVLSHLDERRRPHRVPAEWYGWVPSSALGTYLPTSTLRLSLSSSSALSASSSPPSDGLRVDSSTCQRSKWETRPATCRDGTAARRHRAVCAKRHCRRRWLCAK